MSRLFCVWIALAYASCAAPTFAQGLAGSEMVGTALERSETIREASVRITQLLNRTQGQPEIIVARSPNSLAAAIELHAGEITAARTELQDMHDHLIALRPLPGSEGSGRFQGLEQSGRDAAELALLADGVLASLQAIPATVRAGDQVAYDAAYRTVSGGVVVMHDAQALNLNRRADLIGDDSAAKPQFWGMACFSTGQAALQAGMIGLRDRTVVLEQVDRAANCMRANALRDRALLDAARSSPDPLEENYRLRSAPLDREMAELLDRGAVVLLVGKAGLEANENSGMIASQVNPEIAAITTAVQAVAQRRSELLSQAHQASARQ